MQLVEELSKILKQMGKTINLSYFEVSDNECYNE